jgi:hypothetical protein
MTDRTFSVPKKMQATYDAVVQETDAFCQEYLDEEYAELCRKLTAKLCRKRPSPLERGQLRTWVAAIVYTIGRANFLFDKSQTPHMQGQELCDLLGVAQSTAGNRSKEIVDMFRITPFDHEWKLPSQMEASSLVWMISVNGLILDARQLPREIQEIAVSKGLIPYIPDDEAR